MHQHCCIFKILDIVTCETLLKLYLHVALVATCRSHLPLLILGNGGAVLANIGINVSPWQPQHV